MAFVVLSDCLLFGDEQLGPLRAAPRGLFCSHLSSASRACPNSRPLCPTARITCSLATWLMTHHAGQPASRVGQCLCLQAQIPAFYYDDSRPCYPCIFPQLPRTETVTKCVHGRTLSVWCCNHNPDAGLPADATSAEDHCCVGPLEWQPAAPGCLQQHFHRVQQLSNRANCAAGEEQSTTATLQNYESSLLWLQNYQKVLLAAVAEPRGAGFCHRL